MNRLRGSLGSVNLAADVAPEQKRSWTFVALALCVLSPLLVAGCVGGTKTVAADSSQTPIISTVLTQIPPPSMVVGGTAQVSATVSDDPASAGVNWVTCSTGPVTCGSFSPAHTASGGVSMFTAPLIVPASGKLTVMAQSATDSSKTSSFTFTVTSTITDVRITQPPAPVAPAGATISFAAVVDGDPSNSGIDWQVTCEVQALLINCTPQGGLHSAQGAITGFTIPTTVSIPTTSGTQTQVSTVGATLTLTASATADHAFKDFAQFTVSDQISISLTQGPPKQMLTNATATLSAAVANDTTSSGVTWQVSCAGSPCGTVSPAQSASGAQVVYTAPATVPNPNDPNASHVVTITAFSTAAGFVVRADATVTIVVPVSISISRPVPNDSIVAGATAPLVATVTNDSQTNGGVDWTVSCASFGACGSFSVTHTASGSATIFSAPVTVPTGNTVTITATSTADSSKADTKTVTVTASLPPNQLLLGKFVLLLSGKNSANGPYEIGGVLTGDGSGSITDGAFDVADKSGNASPSVPIVSPSTYSIGTNGRGQINLLVNTGTLSNFGVNGTGAMTLSVVFVDSHHAVVNETDSFGTGTGTLDQQNINDLAAFTSQSAWNPGVYSLALNGFDIAQGNTPYSVASALNINLTASSYSYVTDQSDAGAIKIVPFVAAAAPNLGFSRTPRGEGVFASQNQLNLGLPTHFNLDIWIIDANHFAVTDWRDSVFGSPAVIMTGYLTAQPPSASVSGTYVFTDAGATPANQPEVAGGIFTCGSTGILDVNPLGGAALSNQPINATCGGPSNGRSLIGISGAGSSGIAQFAAYPTLDKGLYLIELDGGTNGTSGPSGAGIALQQNISAPIPASVLSGNYAAIFSAAATAGSQTLTGQAISDGASMISGTSDINSSSGSTFSPSLGAALSGSFTASPEGRFPLTLTATPAAGQPLPQVGTLNTICYIIDANSCLLLGSDLTVPGTGILLLQNPGI